jgi:hypothetical protein
MENQISFTNPTAILTHRPTAVEKLKMCKNTENNFDVTDLYKNCYTHWNEISSYAIFILNTFKSSLYGATKCNGALHRLDEN